MERLQLGLSFWRIAERGDAGLGGRRAEGRKGGPIGHVVGVVSARHDGNGPERVGMDPHPTQSLQLIRGVGGWRWRRWRWRR